MSDARLIRSRFYPTDWWLLAAIVVGTLALFARTAHFDFINFDDGEYVYANPHVTAGLNWSGTRWAFTATQAANWHPLTTLSLMLDVTLFGVRPGAIHLINAAFHAINAGLLFIVLRKLPTADSPRWPAVWVAAMFAVHPLHVESVAWISERKDLLSTLFWMLCTLAYLRQTDRADWKRRLITLALLAAGLMSKPMVVTLPAVFLLLDYWPLKRLSWKSVLEKWPMAIVVALFAVVTYFVQSGTSAVVGAQFIPWSARIENALISYLRYVETTFVPHALAIFYPHPSTYLNHLDLVTPAVVAGVVLAAASVAAWLLRKRAPEIVVGWFWFLGTLVPVIGLIQVGAQARADRYTYVPLIGIFIAIAWSVRRSVPSRILVWPAVVIVSISAALSWRQAGYWRDSGTVMQHAIDVVPDNYLAHFALGEFLESRGDSSRAESEYRSTIAIKPESAGALNNLAVLESAAGRFDESAAHFQTAIQFDPLSPGIHVNDGNLFLKQGDRRQAENAYRDAIRIDPKFVPAYNALATMLAAGGGFDDAISLWRDALRIDPGSADAHRGLGLAMIVQGQTKGGVEELRRAARLDPSNADTMSQLAWILATDPHADIQNGSEALHLAQAAGKLSASPGAAALDALAASWARVGDFDRAQTAASLAAEAAERAGNEALAMRIRNRMKLYRSHRPYTSE